MGFNWPIPNSKYFIKIFRCPDKNQLSKTILYNLNPADNEVMATMLGNFNDGR